MQAGERLRSITDASAQWPTAGEVWRTLTLQAGYNSGIVVLAAALLGLAAGTIGTFALLRKRAMMADALAHCTLPGIALAFLAATWLGREGRSLPVLLLGASITGVLGVLAVQAIVRNTRLRDDAAIGSVLSVFFGAGIVLMSVIQNLRSGSQGGLNHFIYGQTAAMQETDAWLMGSAAVGAAAVVAVFFKEFRVVCFDDRFATSIGVRVWWIDLLMMSLVVVATVVGLQAVGLILIVAMLVIPAAAARFWTERLGPMTVLGGVIGGLSGYLGASASALLPRMPAGAVIVLTAGSLFLVSMLAAPSRGVLAALARQLRMRLRIASDHFLRAMYEHLEHAREEAAAGNGEVAAISIRALAADRRWSRPGAAVLTWWMARRGMVRWRDGAAALTPRGLTEATRVTRNHRLWEEFLVRYAHLAASHVDRAADMVEHALSERTVAELEESLRRQGRMPGPDGPPRSVHPIAGKGGRP